MNLGDLQSQGADIPEYLTKPKEPGYRMAIVRFFLFKQICSFRRKGAVFH